MIELIKDIFSRKRRMPRKRPYSEVEMMASKVADIGNSCVTDEQKAIFKRWFYGNPAFDIEIQITARSIGVGRDPEGFLSSVEFLHLDFRDHLLNR